MNTKAKNKKNSSKVKDREVIYGEVEMTDEEYRQSQNPKIRTTMFLEEDLVRAYKKEAAARGMKYQQLMRETLRQGLDSSSGLEARLRKLEERVFKKRA